MKVAVSIPDELYAEADRLAREAQRSRSELYARALSEYVARHAPDRVTESMNDAVANAQGEPPDAFMTAARRRSFERSEW